MSRPWMPLYVADYLGDTGHLSTVQHGAYILLIMHYWRTGGLPTDDARLSRITKLPYTDWLKIKSDIEALFLEGWRHKRIEAELAKQFAISEKRAFAGRKGGGITANNRAYEKISRDYNGRSQAIAEQLPSKRVAVTTTVDNLSSFSDAARAEAPLAAEGCVRKRPSDVTRAEFEEMLSRRRLSEK